MANRIDLYVDQGADFAKIVTILTETGSNFALSGCTVQSSLTSSEYSDCDVNFTIENYNPGAGQVVIAMSAADTWLLKFREYRYDLTVLDSNGLTTRSIKGTVFVNPGVTGKPICSGSSSSSSISSASSSGLSTNQFNVGSIMLGF
jgi:hypothetical protein